MIDNVVDRNILTSAQGHGPTAVCTCHCYCQCSCTCSCFIFSVAGQRDNEADFQVVSPKDHGVSAGISFAVAS